ncbi:MAG TPA: 6-hydroxycyclohex-1-ene-1-carbonyl-CoA dehydrogenase [Thermoanaerobaculia bacterium]|nr:6-hydroxycyclohex-1-ene-1-carbonyl-CoA dehydrogenase [Thermoanaerobaculia bacterium]
MQITSWVVRAASQPMVLETREEVPGPGEVLVEVAGCGVCHTDLGFFYDGVPTRHPFPLALGHEISGLVVAAGAGAEPWLGRAVVVPAVIPCGECEACRAGRGPICPRQVFPGCDVHGGFGSHVRVPARGLCPVPDLAEPRLNPAGLDLAALSVIADAVSTPYQAIVRSQVGAGDLAVFVGAGGVGGFGVQIAAALGALVAAIDVNEERLAAMAGRGAALTLNPAHLDHKALRRELRALADAHGVPTWRTKIFETSGTPAGQVTAFGLLGHGGLLSVVGYSPKPVELRLSNLMALDATAQGNWGCLPEHYPAVVELVLSGRVALEPFIERRPLSSINNVFAELHHGQARNRLVLIPGH